MKQKIKVAILGTGNIGTDLMFKIRKRSSNMELKLFSGIDKNSSGMKLAREHGVTTSARSIDAILQEKTSGLCLTQQVPVLTLSMLPC